MPEILSAKFWLAQGVLGAFCLILILAVIHLWRRVNQVTDAHKTDVAKLIDEFRRSNDERETRHRTEMAAMIDKYIATNQTQVDRYHALAEKIASALEALKRIVERDRKRGT